jgi:hypothetical protein
VSLEWTGCELETERRDGDAYLAGQGGVSRSLDSAKSCQQVLKYFSYEHFYVIYCKFWELDADHDFLLDAADLAKYGQCTLSYQIVDRIFSQVPA